MDNVPTTRQARLTGLIAYMRALIDKGDDSVAGVITKGRQFLMTEYGLGYKTREDYITCAITALRKKLDALDRTWQYKKA